VDQFIDAGCDSITFHVEVEEPIEPTLVRIRKAGRLAGLAIKPATPLSALDPYRDLIDIIMVMTVEPGFGGQKFMADAAAKIDSARDVFRDRAGERPSSREVHVDGESQHSRAMRASRSRYPRRRLHSLEEGPRHRTRDPADQGPRRRGIPWPKPGECPGQETHRRRG